jgi:hypothetical protein
MLAVDSEASADLNAYADFISLALQPALWLLHRPTHHTLGPARRQTLR